MCDKGKVPTLCDCWYGRCCVRLGRGGFVNLPMVGHVTEVEKKVVAVPSAPRRVSSSTHMLMADNLAKGRQFQQSAGGLCARVHADNSLRTLVRTKTGDRQHPAMNCWGVVLGRLCQSCQRAQRHSPDPWRGAAPSCIDFHGDAVVWSLVRHMLPRPRCCASPRRLLCAVSSGQMGDQR
jgi:hypothetical protein